MQDKLEKEYEEPKDHEEEEIEDSDDLDDELDDELDDDMNHDNIEDSDDDDDMDIAPQDEEQSVESEYGLPYVTINELPDHPELKSRKRFFLESDSILIGTSASAHICLPKGLAAKEHLCLYRHENRWYLRDITDKLRIIVDELDAMPYRLRDGERFLAGSVEFMFSSGTGPETSYDEDRYRKSITDPISHALNRATFYKKLGQDMVSCVQKGRWIAILLMDIDHLEQLNTEHGNLLGDEVLRQITKRIRPKIRQDESFARFNGGLFAFVVPKSERVQAIDMAERIRKLVASEPFVYGKKSTSITVSIGVSAINRIVEPEHLVRIANRNLYDAKQSGQNQVRG